jgi:hypothetical protein
MHLAADAKAKSKMARELDHGHLRGPVADSGLRTPQANSLQRLPVKIEQVWLSARRCPPEDLLVIRRLDPNGMISLG